MSDAVIGKVQEFFEKYPLKRYAKGEIIVQAGADPSGVFFVTEGRISQYDISAGGSVVVVNVFKPGAFFPMSWAINKTSNDYFFEAATDIAVRQASPEDAVQFLQDNPDVMLDLLARVYRGTDGLLRRMAHMMGGDAASRLRFELLNAAYRFGEARPDKAFFVPLTENELARHSGLTRETVSRHIQKLKSDGLIKVTHRGFILRDPEKIEAGLGSSL